MIRSEVITRWAITCRDGMECNQPLLIGHHTVESWVDVTGQDGSSLQADDPLILEVVGKPEVIAEIEACADCHVLWKEPLRSPGSRNLPVGEGDHKKLVQFMRRRQQNIDEIMDDMTRFEAAARLKAAFQQQGALRRNEGNNGVRTSRPGR